MDSKDLKDPKVSNANASDPKVTITGGNPRTGPTASPAAEGSAISAPEISLPKGGGAIRGMGEKFNANAFTGTGSLTVPIATSPGRSGFGPQLSLSYDSGNGNGLFGIGWNLSVPAITRKTDKGLPLYEDMNESDVFILSGAEDLVPLYQQDLQGNWVHDQLGNLASDQTSRDGYTVRRYRPRVEGLFARIERWTGQLDNDVHWRTITRDNVTTIYGKDNNSRIFCPADPSRIFSWLFCESYDSKGNAIVYSYKAEDSVNVDGFKANEHNRTPVSRSANRYLKMVKYGNRTPNRDGNWNATDPTQLPQQDWTFKIVLDYGEHDALNPSPNDQGQWLCRQDPFSTHRATFEVRTYRLCQRVLMFHYIPEELGPADNLIHSVELAYEQDPIGSFITSITRSGFAKQQDQSQPAQYLKKSLPPLGFEYSKVPTPKELAELPVREIDATSLEDLPYGVDGSKYQFIDMNGEGLSGIFTAQAEGWFYKSNLSANSQHHEDGHDHVVARFSPAELIAARPNAALEKAQFLDLAGDGQIDLVQIDGSTSGFYKRVNDSGWLSFQSFSSCPNVDMHNPNLRFVDLSGDGHADILITENEVFTWHLSLAEAGFGPGVRAYQPIDEEEGPRLVFSDGVQSIYLADFSGDGLLDLARIRNGEVCYWPNMGYGYFGAKVNMDHAPWFDDLDQFNQRNIRLGDIDGSGTTDILYIGHTGVDIYRNQSGNGWAQPQHLNIFPHVDNLSTIAVLDLLGNGTGCLVWSSPLPTDARRPMKYLELMDGRKPHLLVKVVNNLGAESRMEYAPSTHFYLQDKQDGKPWITRLPFPVQCVKKVETYDEISGNLFASRYAYHHGFFDGVEREFRGFGMVEQWDTEEFGTLNSSPTSPTNVNGSFFVPPIHTKTWFHTGVFHDPQKVSRQMAHEYYGASTESFDQFLKTLLSDTALPPTALTSDEIREAYRSLKGSVLRQEVYADDGTPNSGTPYSVLEKNSTIDFLQPQDRNRYAIFFPHAKESLSSNYERNPVDPRVQHQLILQTDRYGNTLKLAAVGYGRLQGQSPLQGTDKTKQEQLLITYTENDFTNALDLLDDYLTPMPCETRTYEITGFELGNDSTRFNLATFTTNNFAPILALTEIPYEQPSSSTVQQKRLIKRSRTLYRSNDLTRLLPVMQLESLALAGENYKTTFTPGLISSIFTRGQGSQPPENLLPNPASVLAGQGDTQAGYVDLDGNSNWWIPSGRAFFHPDPGSSSQQELATAKNTFFLPRRYSDPFGHNSVIDYDNYALLPIQTTDSLGNITKSINDYRVLLPKQVTNPNGNRSQVAFDALGMVTGSAVMGKTSESLGDSLENFQADLTQAAVDQFFVNPSSSIATSLLGNASTRIIYDLTRYQSDPQKKLPTLAATLARETHSGDPLPPDGLKIQVSFSYSDGFGRDIQKKSQAEPGPLVDGGAIVDPRWVGSGSIIFNNKGKPVRQYEPFFDDTYDFKIASKVGVSSILFYDPLDRVVATLHPDHTWEKVVFDPWQQKTYDVNDTALIVDPKSDPDVGDFFRGLQDAEYLPTWYQARKDGQLGLDEQSAAVKTAAHANTPTLAYLDVLGRTFLTIDDNGQNGTYSTHMLLDIEGNQREVTDAKGRAVMQYDYDMLGNRIHQASMEAGERWMLNNAVGKLLYSWNSRNFRFRNVYDSLHRPVNSYVQEGTGTEALMEQIIYGETQPAPEVHNLRGNSFQVFDQGGLVTTDSYDFKGNLLRSQRQLSQNYKTSLDWSATVPLETEIYTSGSQYDALNRPIQQTNPDNSNIRLAYNKANLLNQIDVNLHGDSANGQPVWTPFVTNIDYNAKGQRLLVQYGNGANTSYTYDLLNFRLTGVKTLRGGTGPLQDLLHIYDPAGNITHTRDNAQQTIFFRNRRVEPSADYTYDALYRLIEATGREHLGQNSNGQPNPPSAPDAYDSSRTRLDNPGDGNAMGTYVENYSYDEVGNILAVKHAGSDPIHPGWTRVYGYNENSQLEADKVNNRLSYSRIGSTTENYSYDAHGNVTGMPHLSLVQWDFKDQLQATSQQVVTNGGTPAVTWYVYDSNGQRLRKVSERQSAVGQSPSRSKERIYLENFELYHEFGVDGSTITLERETLNVMDDRQRIAMVETRTQGSDNSPQQLIRYQFSNQLGSACLELDGQARIISYEEYYPYGSTSYQAVRSQTEAPKRYRYTGKERDEENGFNYHDARYYAPWLGRWTSADPATAQETNNRYEFCYDNPIRFNDPSGKQPPSQPQAQSHPKMSPEVEAAWAEAEKADYTDESVAKLVSVTEADEKARGQDFLSRQTALDYATIRAVSSVRNWQKGNYGTAIVLGTAGVIESYGVTMFGDTWKQSAVNIGIMAVLSLGMGAGMGALTRKSTGSVSIALKQGIGSEPTPRFGPGHVMVGVDEGTGVTTWSDLRVRGATRESGIITGGDAVVGTQSAPGPNYSVITVPRTPSQAAAAQTVVNAQTSVGQVGKYALGATDCTTYSSSVLNAAGIPTPPLSTPVLNYASVALQSPSTTATLLSISVATTAPTVVNAITSREMEQQMSIPSEHGY